ncbi:hypothetical protein V5E97_16100 [Singulisphaera sp. Ch08]|uniref:Uncharacterized protein n=1 Tax=Singulisphaera sp. Ch08 TaxID=3120278 RepID=A0AAU7CTC5_9BACT
MGDRRGLPSQYEERCLEGFFGVMVIPEDSAADAPDHRAVTLDEGLERRLVTTSSETPQELTVRESSDRSHAEKRLEVSAEDIYRAGSHIEAPSVGIMGLHLSNYSVEP